MDFFVFYVAATASWTGLQGLLLTASPTLIKTLCTPTPSAPTDLESYLCRSLGLALMSLAVLSVVVTGYIPITQSFESTAASGQGEAGGGGSGVGSGRGSSPYDLPMIVVTTWYHGITAFLMYSRALVMSGTFYFSSSISGSLAVLGLLCLMFGTGDVDGTRSGSRGSSGKVSGFPFKNKARDEVKRK